MAAVRSKARVDVGSGPWILEERSQIAQFEAQEFEDFTFAARNEIEWLNEHMADIFSENGLNVTEVFKTPGKLRGKTPRTVRKVPGLDSRVPLSNVFSTTSALDRNLAQATKLHGGTLSTDNAIIKTTGQLQTKGRNANADSGYHGLTEDEMDVDQGSLETMPDSMKPHSATQNEVSSPVNVQKLNEQDSDGQRTSEGSFKTAREEATMKLKSVARDSNVDMVSTDQAGKSAVIEESPRDSFVQPKSSESEEIEQEGRGSLLNDNADLEGAQSPSEQSSPAKPLVRKSSLTFASLPAREPLANKKSIGARSSYFNRYTGGKSLGASRPLDATDDGDAEDQMDLDDERPGLAREESDGDGKTARLHNKSSTQRLHERINALGKSQPSRPSKSIPAVIAAAELSYPKLPPRREASTLEHANDIGTKPKTMHNVEEDEDDWIKPSATQQKESKRPFMTKSHTMDVMEQIHGKESVAGQEMGIQIQDQNDLQEEPPFRQSDAPDKSRPGLSHTKSSSVSVLESPSGPPLFRQAELKKAFSVSNPVQAVATGSDKNTKQTSTPAGSPSKIGNDGPLSASKSKLQSIMKSARGLFTSSAGVSAQAKMETCSPSTLRTHDQDQVSLTDAARSGDNARKAVSPQKQPRNTDYHRTGSSTEKEERMREQEAMVRQESQLISSAREQNSRTSSHESEQIRRLPNRTAQEIKRNAISQKPTRQSPRRHQLPESQQEESLTEDLKPHDALQSSNQNQSSQLQKPKDMRRPMKPAKEAASKPKPQPVSIRVGTLSQRIPLTNTALSSSFQESISHSQPKQSAIVKKASNASLQTSVSNNSLKSSITSASQKPKALIAADRKREQDEKEAQRKLDQKKEMERKRAAQQEETQRREQYQRIEAEKQRERERSAAPEDPRKLAQKQAIEKRRAEMNKKDQQKNGLKPVSDLAHAMQQEKCSAGPGLSHRSENGPARPPLRLNATQEPPRIISKYPAPNPVKPAIKRIFDPDREEDLARSNRPQGGQTYQQNDSKRRRTDDEEAHGKPIRPTMAPPIRQSNVRKEAPKTSIFSVNHHVGPSSATIQHITPSLLKTSTVNQAYQQHPHNQHNQTARAAHPVDMAKYTNAKIPFAETPNPPPASHKPPLQSKQAMCPPTRSSPGLTNGDNYHLEDIPTESEDEDSEDERARKRKQPGWVSTPEIEKRLKEQERVDADAIFGPIPEPNMEDIFRDKNRYNKFRSRTSSANWAGQDRLTEEEIRSDNAARERMQRDGGWTYGL